MKTFLRILLVLAIAGLCASTADAQKGKGKGKKKGGKGKGSSLAQPLPKAAPPVAIDPFATFPKLPRESPKAGAAAKGLTSLLPAPVENAEDLPEIPIFEGDTTSFPWRDPHDPELQRYYFDVCDHDASEWISYREAEVSLQIPRDVFALYDKDRDGRIAREEFSARYEQIVDKAGGYAPPRPAVAKPPTVARAEPGIDPESKKLVETFDEDGDLTLDPIEIDGVIAITGLPRSEVDVEKVLSVTDTDGSRAIELAEIPNLKAALDVAAKRFGIDLDLSGAKQTSRATAPGAIPPISRIALPTAHFARLDQDDDGFLSNEDLIILQSPMHLSVRTTAVLAALDRDADGRLSEEEFRASFR